MHVRAYQPAVHAQPSARLGELVVLIVLEPGPHHAVFLPYYQRSKHHSATWESIYVAQYFELHMDVDLRCCPCTPLCAEMTCLSLHLRSMQTVDETCPQQKEDLLPCSSAQRQAKRAGSSRAENIPRPNINHTQAHTKPGQRTESTRCHLHDSRSDEPRFPIATLYLVILGAPYMAQLGSVGRAYYRGMEGATRRRRILLAPSWGPWYPNELRWPPASRSAWSGSRRVSCPLALWARPAGGVHPEACYQPAPP